MILSATNMHVLILIFKALINVICLRLALAKTKLQAHPLCCYMFDGLQIPLFTSSFFGTPRLGYLPWRAWDVLLRWTV